MKYLLAGLLLWLVACAPPKTPEPLTDEILLSQLSQLPGVVITTTAPLRFSYPDQVMFGTYAVLPMPGGPKLLNPLATFLKQYPQFSWSIDLRVQTIYGVDYDQTLAEKRSELLASYLLGKGVDLQNISFQPSSGDGEPLVFTRKRPRVTGE